MRAGRLAASLGFLLLLVLAVGPERATAHAVLLRTTPATGQTLAVAPARVQLLFSEPIDAVFSRVHVLTASGQAVDNADAHVDEADDHLLVVSLKPGLPNGVYTVDWRSLSTIDVHPDGGQYPLFVGVPVPANAGVGIGTSQLTATPETTLGRWWFYLAAALFAGVLAVWKFVLGPVLEGSQMAGSDHAAALTSSSEAITIASEAATTTSGAVTTASEALRRAVRWNAYRLVVLGGVLLVVGTLYTAVAQAAAAAGVPLADAVGQPLAELLLRGRFAAIWWPRMGLEVVSLVLIALGGLDGLASECVLATLPAVLLTSSLTSHGAALPMLSAAGIGIDWLHILGATAWVGGLTGVLVALPLLRRADQSTPVPLPRADQSIPVLPHVLARFARFAVVASALVVLSGVAQAALEVGTWIDLVVTAYGQLVLTKVVLVGAMLLLAAFNEWRARTAAAGRTSTGGSATGAADTSGGLRGLTRGVRAELALGVVVLGIAAVLGGTPPAPTKAPTPSSAQAPTPSSAQAPETASAQAPTLASVPARGPGSAQASTPASVQAQTPASARRQRQLPSRRRGQARSRRAVRNIPLTSTLESQ